MDSGLVGFREGGNGSVKGNSQSAKFFLRDLVGEGEDEVADVLLVGEGDLVGEGEPKLSALQGDLRGEGVLRASLPLNCQSALGDLNNYLS